MTQLYWDHNRFKSDCHEVYTEEVNKTALSSNDDERLQTFDRVKAYILMKHAFKVCGSEMLKVCEAKATLKMLSKEYKIEMHVKQKEKCKNFLKYVKAKCESKMRKYVKVKKY